MVPNFRHTMCPNDYNQLPLPKLRCNSCVTRWMLQRVHNNLGGRQSLILTKKITNSWLIFEILLSPSKEYCVIPYATSYTSSANLGLSTKKRNFETIPFVNKSWNIKNKAHKRGAQVHFFSFLWSNGLRRLGSNPKNVHSI